MTAMYLRTVHAIAASGTRVDAERLPPDMRKDLPRVVAFYRRGRWMK